MGTLPHLRRENPDENQTGHKGEKPTNFVSVVKE